MSLGPLEFIGVNQDEKEPKEQNPEEEGDDDNVDEPDNEQEDEIYSCKYCQFQTEDIDQLDEHILTHDEALHDEDGTEDTEVDTREHEKEPVISQDTPKVSLAYDEHDKSLYIFVCPFPLCRYQSSKRRAMQMHCTSHCKSLEIPVCYACSECCFTTRRKENMTNHLHIHCESVEVLRYKCSKCSYAGKRKSDLNKHKVCHSNSMEALLTCHLCSYATRRLQDLKRHLIIHNGPEENNPKKDYNTMFNCTQCRYSSKRLHNLNKHVILHSDRSLRDMKGIFKCLNCLYITPENLSFAKHVLRNCSFVENGVTILADGADQNELEES